MPPSVLGHLSDVYLQDALEVAQRLVDQVDDHFGRNHGVYGSALSDMALMMKAMGKHQEATEVYLKALEVCACSGFG